MTNLNTNHNYVRFRDQNRFLLLDMMEHFFRAAPQKRRNPNKIVQTDLGCLHICRVQFVRIELWCGFFFALAVVGVCWSEEKVEYGVFGIFGPTNKRRKQTPDVEHKTIPNYPFIESFLSPNDERSRFPENDFTSTCLLVTGFFFFQVLFDYV